MELDSPFHEFALNNAVHASICITPFYVNNFTHPRSPLTLTRCYELDGGDSADKIAEISPTTLLKQVSEFIATRFSVFSNLRDAMADS